MARTQKLGTTRSRIAVAASAVAVAATVWGAVVLVAPDHAPRPDTSQELGAGAGRGTGGSGGSGGSTSSPDTGTGSTGTGSSSGGSSEDGAKGGGAKGGAQGSGGAAQGRIPDSIAHASESGGNTVNITIDDGPDPQWTPKILEVLARHDVKATFCMIGPQAKAHPDLVKRVVQGGHRLCDHTMNHDTSMDKKPVAYQQQQILDAKRLIEEAAGGGAKVEYYRAPGGAFTPDSRRIAAANGMRPLGWNVDTKDFQKPGTAAIVEAVKREIVNGPTVLFHDGGGDRRQSVEALDQVLAWLKDQGRPTGFPVRTAPDTP
ncbi:polysaccharide deacetylase family protein [Streptomyces sp. NPDC046876]|uniref:polysaccharide deacetylase family protein n=1 Tax=Streptomyces sp. NPDC046876 TaxID=3155616 RepID=UPI0033EE8F4E